MADILGNLARLGQHDQFGVLLTDDVNFKVGTDILIEWFSDGAQ
ncbi:hypothetical protein OQX63_04720 [Pedobacter sp. PF22-3]|nr:hypothetical protein [Pedobacter sp. PF22-3]MCX2492762.1 hypothetical protein [Pedobacter sp. PF22-3]